MYCEHISLFFTQNPFLQLAIAVSAAQQAAVNQAKQQEAFNNAMMQRFPMRAGPPISIAMPGTPVAPMVTTMRPALPAAFIGGSLMRPPPIGMPPGM